MACGPTFFYEDQGEDEMALGEAVVLDIADVENRRDYEDEGHSDSL